MKPPFLWLSFADPDRPAGQRFLGVIVTRGTESPAPATNMMDTLQKLHRMGINPGGEVQGRAYSGDWPVPEAFLDRLLTREEAEALDDMLAGETKQ